MNWISEQVNQDPDLRDTLLLMLEEVQALRLLLLKTERKLRELMWSRAYKQKSELLRPIPGVGPLTAMLFILEVEENSKFFDLKGNASIFKYRLLNMQCMKDANSKHVAIVFLAINIDLQT